LLASLRLKFTVVNSAIERYRISVALSGLDFFWTINQGRRSFHCACTGLLSFGLSALWFVLIREIHVKSFAA